MADRIVAVVALAGALLIALAVAGVFSAPPSPALGASSEYCEYGVDQYGNCLPPPTDSTKPTIGAVQSPAQNSAGWNNTNVTLTVTAADEPGGSGVASITCTVGTGSPSTVSGASRSVLFTATTFNQPVTCTAIDNAGNVSNPVVRTVRIDKVPPSIAFQSQNPVPNPLGWNSTNVTLIWTCTDGFSGVTASAVSRTLVSEAANQSGAQTCNDRAGNTASDVHGGVNIDRTSPVLTFLGPSPLPNAHGWNNTGLTLTWNCTDGLAGVAPSVVGNPVLTSLTATLTDEGAGQSGTGTCIDSAGNTASDTRGGFAIDRTPPSPPVASADRAPDFAGGGGWFKDVVTVSFAANGDPNGANGTAGSGVDPDTIPPPVTFTDDGPHLASGTVSDLAGNESTPGTLPVQVDTAAPVVSATFTTSDGSVYVPGTWTNQAVTATFSCSDDGGSGVASTSPPATITAQGADQSVTGSCTDNVGHTASSTFSGIDVDLTPPEAVVSFDPNSGDVIVGFTDAGGSGVPAGAVTGVPVGGKGPAKDDRRYEQSDGAGNTLAVVLSVKAKPHDLDTSFETLSYNGRAPADAPDNHLHFGFDLAKDGSVKRLSQDIRVDKGPASVHVTADYDPKKDQTKIRVGGPGGDTTRAGLALVTVSTGAGALVVQY